MVVCGVSGFLWTSSMDSQSWILWGIYQSFWFGIPSFKGLHSFGL